MSNQIYSITGSVVDKNTNQGIPNLKVEAWDLRQDQQGSLGSSYADENGHFILCLDLKDANRKEPPTFYFKVYRDSELLDSTEDTVVLKPGDDKEVLIELNLAMDSPLGKDRLSAQQFLTGVDFLTKSDFRGIFTETKRKAGTRIGFLADMIINTVSSKDLKPITVGDTRGQELINQPVAGVRQKLDSEEITVNEVLPYSPQLNKESFMTLTEATPRLEKGQKINLYEENGKVRYYSVVKEKELANMDVSELTKMHKDELVKIQAELNSTRESTAKKDAEILEITQQHKELLSRMNEELNLAKENEAKKNEEISRINEDHKSQLTQLQQDLKASAEIATQRETAFNKLQDDLKSMRSEQVNIMTLLKTKNFDNPVIDDKTIITKKTDTTPDIRKKPK